LRVNYPEKRNNSGRRVAREPVDASTDILVKELAAAVAEYNPTGNALVHIGG